MDMAAVENLNHSELIAMIEADVRSAELDTPDSMNDARRIQSRLSQQIVSSSGASSNSLLSSGEQVDGRTCTDTKEDGGRHSLSTGFYSSTDEQFGTNGQGMVDRFRTNRHHLDEIQVTAL